MPTSTTALQKLAHTFLPLTDLFNTLSTRTEGQETIITQQEITTFALQHLPGILPFSQALLSRLRLANRTCVSSSILAIPSLKHQLQQTIMAFQRTTFFTREGVELETPPPSPNSQAMQAAREELEKHGYRVLSKLIDKSVPRWAPEVERAFVSTSPLKSTIFKDETEVPAARQRRSSCCPW